MRVAKSVVGRRVRAQVRCVTDGSCLPLLLDAEVAEYG